MSKYVPDILSRRWVIISPQRVGRPGDTGKKHVCPVCPGHEKMTPPEVFRLGDGEKDGPGWAVRVVPNKYPITDFHEVIVHTPKHEEVDIGGLPLAQVRLIFEAYRDRYNAHKKKGQVLIFCNHGEYSGASLEHPHSQLVVIPSQINLDTLSREPLNNVVSENKFFNVYCPDFSQWPYEVWIAPKNEGGVFGDITNEEIADLAITVQKVLRQLKKIFDHNKLSNLPFGFNYYIYPKENWYIRITPRFVHRAGFELGTGLSVNIIEPTDAALQFKGLEREMVGVLKKLGKYKK